jgi:hypothetical protein
MLIRRVNYNQPNYASQGDSINLLSSAGYERNGKPSLPSTSLDRSRGVSATKHSQRHRNRKDRRQRQRTELAGWEGDQRSTKKDTAIPNGLAKASTSADAVKQ